MLGDQAEELGRLEARHDDQVMTHQQREGGVDHPGVVRHRHRHQADIALLCAQRLPEKRTGIAAVATDFDELGATGAAAGSHRLPRRRNGFGQGFVGISAIGGEIGREAGDFATRVSAADQQRARTQCEDALELGVGQSRGQRLRDCAEFPACNGRFEELDGVGDSDCHVIAQPDTAFGEGAGQPVGGRVELRPGKCPARTGDGGAFGDLRGDALQLGTDRGDGRRHQYPPAVANILRGLSTSIVVICSSVTPRARSAGRTSLWMCR